MSSGGHFAALEEPELLVNDLVKFSRDSSLTKYLVSVVSLLEQLLKHEFLF